MVPILHMIIGVEPIVIEEMISQANPAMAAIIVTFGLTKILANLALNIAVIAKFAMIVNPTGSKVFYRHEEVTARHLLLSFATM